MKADYGYSVNEYNAEVALSHGSGYHPLHPSACASTLTFFTLSARRRFSPPFPINGSTTRADIRTVLLLRAAFGRARRFASVLTDDTCNGKGVGNFGYMEEFCFSLVARPVAGSISVFVTIVRKVFARPIPSRAGADGKKSRKTSDFGWCKSCDSLNTRSG